MSEFAIEAVDVSKKFLLGRRSTSLKDRLTGFSSTQREEFWAFRNVSIDVPKGSMLGVIGRNGSGKSTFLRTLCGVYRPTTGHVKVRGRVTALLELGAGFHQDLTGRENIYMNAAVVGLERAYVDSVMDEIIEMADIGSFIDAPIETYSSGMRARLGFAVSVRMEPEILLADEITAVGDIAFKAHGAKRMDELREQGTTIVQVSHNLGMLAAGADQLLWLHHGQVRRIGDPASVIDEYKAAAETDRSGRMMDGEVRAATPVVRPKEPVAKHSKGAARRKRRAAVTEALAATDINSSWIESVTFDGEDGEPQAGSPAVITIELRPESPLVDPQVELRVLAAGGAKTGLGYSSGPIENMLDADGSGTLVAQVDPLTLMSGRYNLRVDLRSDGEVVATKTTIFRVAAAPKADDAFATLPATWRVTASH